MEKSATKTGQLFKVGCQVANQQVVTEACRKIISEEEQVKAEPIEAKLKKEAATKTKVTQAYNKFTEGGKIILFWMKPACDTNHLEARLLIVPTKKGVTNLAMFVGK